MSSVTAVRNDERRLTMIVALDGQALQALSHPYAVDGRVSWHPPSDRGIAMMNCYVIRDGDETMLVETGLRIHRDALLEEIGQCVGPRPLDVLVLRQQEFDSVCNVLPIVHDFAVKTIYGQHGDVVAWANFLTDAKLAADATIVYRGTGRASADVISPRLGVDQTIRLGDRALRIFRPELRLLQTHWMYDERTYTLFTSDSFTHAIASNLDDSPLITSDNDTISVERVEHHLLHGRFWWLAGAHADGLRRWLAGVFDEYDVRTIAPSYGRILQGQSVVARHYQMVDDVMAKMTANARAISASR
jgi:flavorubredoxin